MTFDPNLVAPFKSGLLKYYKPFLIGNDAFTTLDNCYVKEGIIRKREGSIVLGRITKWGTIDVGLNSITNTSPPVVTETAHGLLTGDMVFLENVVTNNGTITAITSGISTLITTSGAHGITVNETIVVIGATGTIAPLINNIVVTAVAIPAANQIRVNIDTTGKVWSGSGTVNLGALEKQAFAITVTGANTYTLQDLGTLANLPASGAAQSADVYLPIVGTRIFLLVSAGGNEQLIVFTPKQAWLFNTSTQTFVNISFDISTAAILWNGTRDNFFYTSNYQSVMWTTNNVINTGTNTAIRFFNGSLTAGWQNYNPIISGVTTLQSTLIILPYKGRLVALNTTENSVNFQNRARWSQIGSVFAGTGSVKSISNITAANPAVITSAAHGFITGQVVGITNVQGTMSTLLNGNSFVITVIDANNFSVPVNTTGRTYTANTGNAQLMTIPATGFSPQIDAWRDDIPGRGGFNDADTSEKIVSAEIIQDTLIVGFQFSSWRLRYTGNEVLPFVWERINTQFGSEATFSSIPFDDFCLYISRRGIVGASFNDVDRIDMDIPDQVNEIETGNIGEAFNRVHGIRDLQKRLVYWIYGDETTNAGTPNKLLLFNYQDKTWATFTQSFTTLGLYKRTLDNIWSTWTSIWEGDTETWDTPFDQSNTIIVVAGAKDSRVWHIMNNDVSTDNGVNYNFLIETNLINPYFAEGKRCKLAYYDLYITNTDEGQVTVENYTDDDPTDPWLIKKVDTNDNAISANPVKINKYIRVFLGMVARNHFITITMSPQQLADPNIGSSDFEIQGIIFHTRREGRIKQ